MVGVSTEFCRGFRAFYTRLSASSLGRLRIKTELVTLNLETPNGRREFQSFLDLLSKWENFKLFGFVHLNLVYPGRFELFLVPILNPEPLNP